MVPRLPEELTRKMGLDFQIRLLRRALAREPEDFATAFRLSNLLSAAGRHQEALALDLRLVGMRPDDPVVHYNLACSHALLGRRKEALASLERAVELGWTDASFMLSDEDLRPLRGDPGFLRILHRLLPSSESETRGRGRQHPDAEDTKSAARQDEEEKPQRDQRGEEGGSGRHGQRPGQTGAS